MPLTNEEFEKAFAESQSWEPRAQIPLVQRLAEMFPEKSFEDINVATERCREIKSAAAALAAEVSAGERKESGAFQIFGSRYSDLTYKALSRSWRLARFSGL